MRLGTNEEGVTYSVSHLEVQNESNHLSEAVTIESFRNSIVTGRVVIF